MTNNRLAGADLIRALACIMVVGSHVAQRVAPTALPDWGKTVQAAWMMGAYGVGAFFVLSGYLLARPFWSALDAGQPMPSLKIYALRRAARILPGYYLALTVSFVLSFTLLRFPFDPSLVVRYGAGLLLLADVHWLTWFPVEFNGPLWSIGCEVTSYALLPVGLGLVFALPMLRGWSARIAWLAVVGAVVGLQILVVQHLQPDSFQRSWEFGLVGGAKVWMPNFSPVGFFAVFALGALGAGIQVRLARLRSLWFDLLALAGLAVAVGAMAARFPDVDGFGIANIPYAFPWFPLGVGVMLCTIPSAVLLPRLTETAPIAFLARISFGIYVWHFLLMESVRVLWVPNFGYWGMTSVSLWTVVSAAVVVAAIVVATLSYYRLEALVLGWARRLERRPDGPAATLSPATTG
jgi:peptidoglycan/LPS O-acetylase OafA/YrhL